MKSQRYRHPYSTEQELIFIEELGRHIVAFERRYSRRWILKQYQNALMRRDNWGIVNRHTVFKRLEEAIKDADI